MAYQTHYPRKKVSSIDPRVDSRIRVVGVVVDKKENTVVIDDGSGKIKAFVDMPSILERMGINQIVRVFGIVLPTESDLEIKADIVQDLSGMDINLYKKVDELYNRVGV